MRFILLLTTYLCILNPILLNGQAVLLNTGNMSVEASGIMYVGGDIIQQDSGLTELDGNVILTGNFVNNVSQGNVFTSSSLGSVDFIGDNLQKITGSAQKDTNYINFPNVNIKKDAMFVEMYAGMGANIKTLDLKKGKLVLTADHLVNNKEISTHNSFSPYRMAHLKVNQVVYNRLEASQKGVVEVEMLLPKNPDRNNKLFGFTSPYKSVYTDYFYGNYLSSPSESGLWGSDTTSIKLPNIKKIQAGVGYIGGQNILPENRFTLDPVWGNPVALYNARFVDTLVFNRYKMEDESNPIANITTAQADRYSIEELNTSDVTIALKKGWQYIGNPFTSPLDMELFLNTVANTGDQWKVIRTNDKSAGVANRYWVMAGGTGALDNWTPDRFYLNATWLVGQKVGSTIAREADDKHIIAPMQMIAVYANQDVSITIPASLQTHKLSNAVQTATDELLLEVGNGKEFDRLALVFRNGATTAATDEYDVTKVVDSLASPGQIFTITAEGYAAITNVLPATEKSIEMGMIPTLDEQDMVLTAHRVSTLSSVSQAWLEDRVTGGSWVDLKTTAGYAFKSKPDDRIDRFVIHINVAANSQVIAAKPLPANLFANASLPAVSKVAVTSTGPVGSTSTNVKVVLDSDTVCDGASAKITINPSLNNVMYNVFDAYKAGNLKGNTAGNGGLITVNGGVASKDTPIYYVEAKSTDGLVTIVRRKPVEISLLKTMEYPDIRVSVCNSVDQEIKLSKYLDTLNFKSVQWTNTSNSLTMTGDTVKFTTSSKRGVHVFKYQVTDYCKVANEAKLYLDSRKPNSVLPDTIVVCYQTADALQLNRIFGINAADNEIEPEIAALKPTYVKKSVAPQVFAGAITFAAKEAYLESGLLPAAPAKYGADAKQAVFTYTPAAGTECFTKSEYKVVIILTKD